ncbi:MAG: glycosyltransferase [Lachnospiraceae bacterium]|nr:glycosyltransferase [Lachnospiraceae bacterium]
MNYAIIVCARNEERVIGNLLDSLQALNYPKDKYKVFVVAHNCTDNTAVVAIEHGATVFMRNNSNERSKGDALKFGINEIKREYPGEFDALCVFDADNVAGKDFLKEINAALQSGADMAQGFRHSKNYHENGVSELFGAYWYQIMICQNLPHSTMGLPATISGTGFAVKMSALEDGWQTYTLLEDIEFTCQMVLAGKKCIIAPYALFYDEQPVDLKTGLCQRYRWSVGGYQVLKMYLPKFIKKIPVLRGNAFKMIADLLLNPVLLTSLVGCIIKSFLNLVTGGPFWFMIDLLINIGVIWVSILPVTIILFCRQKMNPLKNLTTLFMFPFFCIVSMFFAVPALFSRNYKWKPIPHKDCSTIQMLENKVS